MIKIGLDLAVRTVGVAIYDPNCNSLIYNSHLSKEKNYFKLQIEMVDWVFSQISSFFCKDHTLILESLFLGVNPKATINASKIQGGIIDRYYVQTSNFPRIISAIQARKALGIKSQISKAEIQLEIIERFNLANISSSTKGEIINSRNIYEGIRKRKLSQWKQASKILKKRLTKEQKEAKKELDKLLNRMSTQIKKETGIDEHMADAIVLAIGESNVK